MDLSPFTIEERQDLARFYTFVRDYAMKRAAKEAEAAAEEERKAQEESNKAKDDPAPSKD